MTGDADWLDVQRELQLCWLAHALHETVARFFLRQRSHFDWWLLGLDHEADALHAVLRRQEDKSAVARFAGYSTPSDAPTAAQWLQEQQTRPQLVVVYTSAALTSDVLQQLTQSVEETHVTLVAMTGPTAQLLETQDRVQYIESSASSFRHWPFILRPLTRLWAQCGWRFAIEMITQSQPDHRGANSSSLFVSSVARMPFQMLLLVLRWSYFHPRVLGLLGKAFERKLQLIPQQRHRDAIRSLLMRNTALWPHDVVSDRGMVEATASITVAGRSSAAPLVFTCRDDQNTHQRLSKCRLWDVQKQFYVEHGIRAWSDSLIPFGVSSSSFLAAAYAQVAVDFFLDAHQESLSADSRADSSRPNCFVWEAASGSCKFLHAFVQHFFDLAEANSFQNLGLVPCVIASDLSDQVISSRMEMTCFKSFLERGQLDFARFDSQAFARSQRKSLRLQFGQRDWHVGQDGPVLLIGNYFFDSLRADAFVVTRQQTTESAVYEVLVDRQTDSIPVMRTSCRLLPDPSEYRIYSDDVIHQTFLLVLDQVRQSPTFSSSSLMLFPVETMEFILSIVRQCDAGKSCRFPLGLLAGDANFSFRDPLSSAVITTDLLNGTELEIPQLSPHPDCFCLPVDFEVLQAFFQQLHHSQSVSVVVESHRATAAASDTFEVLYGTIVPSTSHSSSAHRDEEAFNEVVQASHRSFVYEFASFTPSDCDLLWGMMGVDGGTHCFSLEMLLTLLAQTAWDYDLFVILQWQLIKLWRQHPATSDQEDLSSRLLRIGTKCWRTLYVLDERSGSYTKALSCLQFARWCYELRGYDQVLRLLSNISCTGMTECSVLYLLGLACFQTRDHWNALVYFRKCVALDPTRVKFQRRIALTLRRLQIEVQIRQQIIDE